MSALKKICVSSHKRGCALVQLEPGALHQRADFLTEFEKLLKRMRLFVLKIHYRICQRHLFCLKAMLFSPTSCVISSCHWLGKSEILVSSSQRQW